jgi:hypothetical protein
VSILLWSLKIERERERERERDPMRILSHVLRPCSGSSDAGQHCGQEAWNESSLCLQMGRSNNRSYGS